MPLQHNSFDKLFSKHFNKLVAFINSYINNREESYDLAQASLIAFWERRDTIKEGQPIEPYLYAIAKNRALDYIKAQKVRMAHSKELYSAHSTESMEGYELNEMALELFDIESYRVNKLKEKLRLVLLTLPISDRKIFVLSRFNNLTNDEIAQILNISVKTVEKRISLTLKILRKELLLLIIFIK